MNGKHDYNMSEKMLAGSVEHFTKEQRQRLEALTFARKLTKDFDGTVHLSDWERVASYIITGNQS